MSLHKLAAQIADKGRYGDTELVHMNRSEIEGLERMLGTLTRNPHTGQLEAFSWGKMIAAWLLAGAAPFTGGATLGPAIALGASSFQKSAKDASKNKQVPDSEAGKYIRAKDEEQKNAMAGRGIPIIGLDSLKVQPQADLLGREQNYFEPPKTPIQPMTGGGIRSLMGYAQGGMLEPEEQRREAVHSAAMAAIRGDHDDPHTALNEFVKVYGPDALQRMAEGGMVDDDGPGGMIEGPGDGMDDMVTGNLNGDQKILVSNDEFIIPADVVSGLGNGSSEGGARFLHSLMDRVRHSRTGMTQQPQKINPEEMIHG